MGRSSVQTNPRQPTTAGRPAPTRGERAQPGSGFLPADGIIPAPPRVAPDLHRYAIPSLATLLHPDLDQDNDSDSSYSPDAPFAESGEEDDDESELSADEAAQERGSMVEVRSALVPPRGEIEVALLLCARTMLLTLRSVHSLCVCVCFSTGRAAIVERSIRACSEGASGVWCSLC